jgi:predicted nucleotide-binding protein
MPGLKVLGITQRETPETEKWFRTHGNGLYLKSEALQNPGGLIRCVADLGAVATRVHVRAFIVHGHDLSVRNQLKQMLEEYFRVSVVVLDEQPSRGRTIIEKFDDEAGDVDIVFVLLTPDDVVVDRSHGPEHRARQNVLLELGYFLGRLARRRGRVVVLHKQGVAVPSDLHGVVLIDVTHGVESARSAIAKELAELIRREGHDPN